MLGYKFFVNLFQEKVFQKQKLLETSLFFLAGCCLTAFISFCFFSSGLNEDGSYNLFYYIKFDTPILHETPRLFFNFLHGFPTLFILNYPLPFSFITQAYSFSLICLHLASFIFCFLILPPNKKHFMFFPFFYFLTGPFFLLDISVSVAFSVSSWLWLTAFIIHYTDLSKMSHKALFLATPMPLLLSHEMMSFLSWALIALCLFKYKNSKGRNQKFEKLFISFSIVFFVFVSFLQSYFILNSESKSNLASFQSSLFAFKFLFEGGRPNLLVVTAFVLKLGLLLELFKKKFYYFQVLLILFVSLAFCLILFPSFSIFQDRFFTGEYDSRVYPIVISLPFCLFMWGLAELKHKKLQSLSKLFLYSFCITGVAFTVYRLKSDLEFYKYRKNFSLQLSTCEGMAPLSSFKKLFPKLKPESLWKITADSLILPQKKLVQTALYNDSFLQGCEKYQAPDCGSRYRDLRFNLPEILSDESFRNNFFNFQPLFENWKAGKNSCKKTSK